MAYSWELSNGSFPIAEGAEIRWEHFENLRRYIYVKRFLSAGADLYDYESPITSSTWETWVDNNFITDDFTPDLDYTQPAWTRLLNLVFQSTTGMAEADLFSVCTTYAFTDIADLKANPPTNSSGVLNSKWCYAVDVSRYHDFDTYSGRKIVKRYTAATGQTYLSVIEGYRYLPQQVGPNDQQRFIQYTDTARTMPHRKFCEFNRLYITQPATLGPNFNIELTNMSGTPVDIRDPIDEDSEGENIGTTGWQDTLSPVWAEPGCKDSGYPSGTLPQKWADTYQAFFDPKYCAAYQNQVEAIIGGGRWMILIDPDTDWGAEWIQNHNETKFSWVSAWPSYDDGGDGYYYSRVDSQFWRISYAYDPPSSPSEANHWRRVDWGHELRAEEQTYDEMSGENWGCNGSAVELALWIIGSYDWYFESSYICPPYWVRYWRYQLENASPPEDPDSEYPLPAGLWRRTHRYTMGRPKGSAKMMPGTMTPDGYTYADYQGAGANTIWWPGIFVPDAEAPGDESSYLSESQAAEIVTRHEKSVHISGADYYELRRELLNDLWELLDLCDLRHEEATLQFGYRTATAYESGSSASAAFTAARSAALTDIADNAYSAMGDGARSIGQRSEVQGSGASWTASVILSEIKAYVDVTGEIPIEKLNALSIAAILRVKPDTSDDTGLAVDWPWKEAAYDISVNSVSIGLASFEASVPNFANDYYCHAVTPDEPSAEWYDWGGRDPDWGLGVSTVGKMFLVEFNLAEGAYVSDQWEYPCENGGFAPSSFSSSTSYNRILCRAHLYHDAVFSGIAIEIDFDPAGIDWDTIAHIAYTEIAVDDLKFDSDGKLISL